jgi:hypothetical protein
MVQELLGYKDVQTTIDLELQKLAQRLVKPNGEVCEESNW